MKKSNRSVAPEEKRAFTRDKPTFEPVVSKARLSGSTSGRTLFSSGATDQNTTIQDLKDLVIKFRDERGWQKHHTPKNLSMSIAIEAAELMEHFQWDELSKADKQEVASELADILSFSLSLAAVLDIDLATAYQEKLAHNARKYPVEIFNTEANDTSEAYNQIKKEYREGRNA